MSKPLHVVLRQYRALQIALITFLGYLTWDSVEWYYSNYDQLTQWQNAPIMAFVMSLTAGMFGLAKLVIKKHEKDDDNE